MYLQMQITGKKISKIPIAKINILSFIINSMYQYYCHLANQILKMASQFPYHEYATTPVAWLIYVVYNVCNFLAIAPAP